MIRAGRLAGFCVVTLFLAIHGQSAPAKPTASPTALTHSDETLTKFIRFRSRLKNFQTKWGNENGDSTLDGFSAELGGGKISGAGKIYWTRPEANQTLRIDVSGVDLRQLLAALNIQVDGHFDTKVSGVLDFQWQGLRLKQIKSTARGKVRLQAAPGYLTDMHILNGIAGLCGMTELRRIDFTNGILEGEVQAGRFQVELVQLTASNMEFAGRGWVDLPTENIDMVIQSSVTPELGETSTQPEVRAALLLLGHSDALRTPRGFIRLPVEAHFTGTLTEPILNTN
ncbi:MAG: AsmA-like C-terminal region-containing protein [Candidatus Sumerlaeaceae bacterium]|nr:AsmA-like C-terminal region-containing protein [Candidatus Sumerlaeaceae bacterium]